MQLYYKKMDWCLWFAIWDAWLYISNFRGSEINLQTFHRDVALTIPTTFLVIYENEKPAFEYPEITKFSMENQTNVEYKISFMGFSGKCHKYDKWYFSYIRTNENYWLSVDVTKSSPSKKIRTLPREGLIPSVVVYICLAATTFEIISSKKVGTKRKKTTKKRNSIDVLSNLRIKTNVELVRTCVLAKYLEYDRRKAPLPDRSKRCMMMISASALYHEQ